MSRKATRYVKIDARKCKACWKCVDECPRQVIGKIDFWFHKHVMFRHSEACIGCRKCIETCPHGAYVER